MGACRGQRRTCGIEAGRCACTICVDRQLLGMGRHILELLAVPVGCMVAVREGDSNNVDILVALPLPLRCLIL